jgi:hypothetical protein
MLPKLLIACLLPIITINAHNAVRKLPSIIITGASSLNITHLLAHKTPDTLRANHNTYRLGDTTFHSLAFSLQEEYRFALRESYNLARFTAESSDSDNVRLPGLIWVQGDQLYARLVTGTLLDRKIRNFSLGGVEEGRWYVVSVLVKWGFEETGELHIWVDGVKVLEEWGVDTIMDDGDDDGGGRVFRFEGCGLGRCLGL